MAQRATSLGPKPSFFVIFLLFFPFFAFNRKNCFPPPQKRALLLVIECLPLFLLSLFWPPPFSLPLSLNLSSSFLSSFLLVFLSLLSFGSFSCLFLYFSFFFGLFHEKNDMKLLISKFFINPFSCFGFLSCFLFQMPFSCLCFFLILICVFCSTSMFLLSKKTSKKWTRGVATKVFFYEPVFCKMWKVTVFWPFLPNFGWCSKNTNKTGISSHFYRPKKGKNILRCYYLGQVHCNLKMANLAQIITPLGTNTPKFVPSRWGWPPFDPTETGLCKFGWVWSSLKIEAQGCTPVM